MLRCSFFYVQCDACGTRSITGPGEVEQSAGPGSPPEATRRMYRGGGEVRLYLVVPSYRILREPAPSGSGTPVPELWRA